MQAKEDFRDYMGAFEKKLELVVADDISSRLLCSRYLAHLLRHKKYYLAIYADVLHKLVLHSPKEKAGTVLIDFGSGNGLLGIFAKFCGFKKVFLNDINADFILASEKLAAQLNIEMDGYITGDILAAAAYFKNEKPDAIAGTDVIEHIYSLESFFKTLQQMNPLMVSVFTTASNPGNYFKVNSLKKLQLKDELLGGTADDFIKSGESPMKPYLQIREQIIRKHMGDRPDNEILVLAKATRGLNEQDIVVKVKEFRHSGKLPDPAIHGTNTCDPLSGSWTERVLSFQAYTLLYHSAGFAPKFYNGFYNMYDGGYTRLAKQVLNAGIHILGNMISPYIIIAANGQKSQAG